MGQPCNQESSIKLTHPPCTVICTRNCPTLATVLVNQNSPETGQGVNAGWKTSSVQLSASHVNPRCLVFVSEGGCCPLGALLREKGQGPAAQTSLPRAGGKGVESQRSVVSYFWLTHLLLPRSGIINAYLSCKMWN